MLKILIKKQLREQYAGLFFDQKKNKARSGLATIGMIILTVLLGIGVFGVLLTMLSLSLCPPLTAAGLGWLYFMLMGMIALLLGVLGGSFAAFTHLYKSKDNDTLLSLPIPVRNILEARILSVYFTTGGMTLLTLLPALIVYWIKTGFTLGKFLGGLLFALAISLLALVLGCLLGYLVARISTKLKNKSVITVLTSLLIMGLYYFFYFRFQGFLQELTKNPAAFQRLERIPGLKFFGQAGEGQVLPLLFLVGLALLLFGLTLYLLARSFRRIISAADSVARVRDKGKTGRKKTPFRALLGKELTRLTTSPGYMLNGALGSFLLLLLAGAILIKGGDVLQMLQQVAAGFFNGEMLTLFGAALVAFMAETNTLTAPSVSLEGKQLWILKSLPVDSWSILKAKLGLHWLITGIPALLCSLSLVLVMKPRLPELLLLLLYPQLCIFLFAALGLTMGLLRPNLNWTNEMVPIKQSIAVLITMFGGMFYGIAVVGLYFLIGQKLGASVFLGIVCLLTLVLALLLLFWLRRKGCRKWEAL